MKNMTFTINFLACCQDKTTLQDEVTWEGLLAMLSDEFLRKEEMTLREYQGASDEKRKAVKDGPAWIPCSLVEPRAGRTQANMDQAYLLVLDIDTGMSLADVKSRIDGYEAVIHSSFSHSPEKPKWRVVLPLAASVPAGKIGEVFDHFQVMFDGKLDTACGHDSARMFYLPACPADAEHHFVFEHLEGDLLDGTAMLKQQAAITSKHPASHGFINPLASPSSGVSEGNRNNAAFKRACSLFNQGLSDEEVLADVQEWNKQNSPPLEEKELGQTIKSAMKSNERKSVGMSEENEIIVDNLNRKFAWVIKPSRIYRFEHHDFASVDALHQQYSNTTATVRVGASDKIMNHFDVWLRSEKRRTHLDIDFIPGGGEIVGNTINLWDGWGVSAVAGDISPWNSFLDHLFGGNPDMRRWFEQWIAYPIQHPGAKLSTAVVLWSSKQGVGKSMVGETICSLYGNHARIISAAELHGNYNNWMRCSQFILGEENSSGDQRADANKLKVLITGNTVVVNEKYQPSLELKNCANFLFTSNDPSAFYLEDADRRFFVWEIVADRKPDVFYDDFVDWRDKRGGLTALMDHLQKINLTGFAPKGNAPVTEAKQEMIRHSKSDMERWLADSLEDSDSIDVVFGKDVSSLEDITHAYNCARSARTSTTAVSRALKRHSPYASRRVMTRSGRRNLLSLTNHEAWERADNPTWAVEYDHGCTVSL